MTYEEALKYLQDRYEKHLFNTEENLAIAKAMEALKEMLPKKPIEDIGNRVTEFKCPRCKGMIAYKVDESFMFSALLENNICRCGQEIDWSKERSTAYHVN